jgi:rare lipoprotein A
VLSAPPFPADGVPDAVPRVEPRSRYGNPPFYVVFGKRYYVLASSVGYVERGVASWYGPGFHEVNTSTGEPYNMYAMTAAHKTLPLPAYVRVTNLQNGRSIVVRVNDRGPFVGNRIIDLSYTAAYKLDMLRNGTAMVEVRAIDPAATDVLTASVAPLSPAAPVDAASSNAAGPNFAALTAPGAAAPNFAALNAAPNAAAPNAAAPNATTPIIAAPVTTAPGTPAPGTPAPPPIGTPLYVQAGAFSDPANAERLAAKLRGGSFGPVFVRDNVIAGHRMYRVRIGPVPNVPEFDRIVAALERAGVSGAHLALDP